MPKPNPWYPFGYAGAAESAATGNRIARWALEAVMIGRGWLVHTNGRELALIVLTVAVFEALVAGAHVVDSRRRGPAREEFRTNATRTLIVAAGLSFGFTGWFVRDVLLFFVACFVVFTGIVATRYNPDILFGGHVVHDDEPAS